MVDASLPGQACQGRVPSDAPRRSERCALVLETPGPAGRLAAMDLSLSLAAAGPPAERSVTAIPDLYLPREAAGGGPRAERSEEPGVEGAGGGQG
jgi:hypothetical protein